MAAGWAWHRRGCAGDRAPAVADAPSTRASLAVLQADEDNTMMQQQGNSAEGAYRPGSLELVIALGSLALIIGIGVGVLFNQSVSRASISAAEVAAQPTRMPKPAARVKPTA